jgi:hypothetical protein
MAEYLSNIKFAELVGVTRAAVGKAIKEGRIIKTKMGVNPEHPTNIYYAECVPKNKAILTKGSGKKKAKKNAIKMPKMDEGYTNGEKEELKKSINRIKSEDLEIEIDFSDLEGSLAGLPPKAIADFKKIVEQVKMLRLKRDEKRKELIPRSSVRSILSRMYQIETNEFVPLGTRVAPDIAALCGLDDPEKILLIDERIENEVYKILEHMKIEINKYLEKQEAKVLKEEKADGGDKVQN